MQKSIASFFLLLSVLLLSSFRPQSSDNMKEEILRQTNALRKSNGLAPLQLNESLSDIAAKHSRNMASGKTAFGHKGFNGRSREAAASLPGSSSFAENVAFGATSATEVMQGWKNSSGHRRNMLGKYRYIGIGIATDKRGRIYYTQVFAG